MIRSTQIAIPLIAALAMSTFAQTPEPYTSSEGKYSIKFGGKPTEDKHDVKLASGAMAKVYSTIHKASGAKEFVVTYCDYPESAAKESAKSILEGVRDGSLKDATKLEDKEISYPGETIPGREYALQKGMTFARFRVYLRGTRLYQIAVFTTSRDDMMGKEADDFLNSFKVLK